MDFDEFFWSGGVWPKDQVIKFWLQYRSRCRSRNFAAYINIADCRQVIFICQLVAVISAVVCDVPVVITVVLLNCLQHFCARQRML